MMKANSNVSTNVDDDDQQQKLLTLERQHSFFRQAHEYDAPGGPQPIQYRVARRVTKNMHKTILHAFQHNTINHPHTIFIRWVNQNCQVTEELSYQQLWNKSIAVVKLLKQKGILKGDRIMIAYPFGLQFLSGLVGCMMYGAIACSVYPPNPTNRNRAEFSFQQFNNQVQDAGADYALTTTSFKRIIQAFCLTSSHKTHVKWIATDKLKETNSDPTDQIVLPSQNDIAFIQYSSGSTGDPKGIMISHGALAHNIQAVQSVSIDLQEEKTIGVCWMPQYHDFGLINFFLTPVFSRYAPTACCSPLDFIKNPLLWADMLEMFQATQTGGPNFAFGLLCKRLKAANRTLDVPHLIRASIAAEPINPSTIDAMEEAGFLRSSIYPCYGLAECCAFATGCFGNEVTIDEQNGVVSCGLMKRNEAHNKEIIIVKDDKWADPGEVGQIHISGHDLASGYWNKPDLTREIFQSFQDPKTGKYFMNTGDLGKIDEKGLLYVCGRSKELIIINGRNVYPTDLERTIEKEYPDIVRPGSTVAFQWKDDNAGIVLEIRNTAIKRDATSALTQKSIRRLINSAYNVQVGCIFVLKQGAVPKTTSGKLRRVDTRDKSHQDTWSFEDILWAWKGTTLLQKQKQQRGPSKSNHQFDNNYENKASPSTATDQQKESDFETLVNNTLGGIVVNMDTDWEANGLTSLQHAELRSNIEQHFHVSLPLDFDRLYPTPSHLMYFVLKSSSNLFPNKMPDLTSEIRFVDTAKSLSMAFLVILQAIGILLQFFVFALSLIPPYFVGKALSEFQSTFEVGSSGRFVSWSWFPFVVPTFFASFSVIVLMLKWIVVGKYRSRIVELPSITYFRWWLVDRILELWEVWVGGFLLETKFIWLFYRLMGVKMSWSTDVDEFIREFDLVSIGQETRISQYIRCRKFRVWKEENQPASMIFRPIVIGKQCTIKGFVSPGVSMGDGSRINPLSALQEGAQVPERTIATGNPAFDSGRNSSKESGDGTLVHICRMIWLVVELYLFFVCALVGQVILNDQLPSGFRYSPLLYWFLLLSMNAVFSMMLSIILKWVLIGRRRPGDKQSGKWWGVVHWCVDYHYKIACLSLSSVASLSFIWSIILYLHGMDIKSSFIRWPQNFLPSKMDFFRLKSSFLPSVSFNFPDKDLEPIEIVDSSVGYQSEIESGTKIHRSVVPPRSIVANSIYDKRHASMKGIRYTWKDIVEMELLQWLCYVLLFSTLIPSFEIFSATVLVTRNLGVALVGLWISIMAQCIVWILAQRVIQAYKECRGKKINWVHFFIYHNQEALAQRYSMITVLYGTPFFSAMLKYFWGTKVEGHLWYFGAFIGDHGSVTFGDHTIFDHSLVDGHYVVYNKVNHHKTHVQGVVHGWSFLGGGALLAGTRSEFGPLYFSLGGDEERTIEGSIV